MTHVLSQSEWQIQNILLNMQILDDDDNIVDNNVIAFICLLRKWYNMFKTIYPENPINPLIRSYHVGVFLPYIRDITGNDTTHVRQYKIQCCLSALMDVLTYFNRSVSDDLKIIIEHYNNVGLIDFLNHGWSVAGIP